MAYKPRACEFLPVQGQRCSRDARFIVLTQMPPYTKVHACFYHLNFVAERLLGSQQCPVVVLRYHAWWS